MAAKRKTLFDNTQGAIRRPGKVTARQAGVSAVAICGVGLIGGSIAERLKSKRGALRIIGYDRKVTIRRALNERLIDKAETSLKTILAEADIVILSANPASNEVLLKRLSCCDCDTSALILDTGSMQTGIARLAQSLLWKNNARFISAHPMAGREVQGLQNRQTDLFVDHPFFFDDSARLALRDIRRLSWFTRTLGSYPIFVNSKTHDQVMTDISQIPQLLSTLIGAFVQDYERQTIRLAGTGLQSMIRLGGSPYSNWHDVFVENSPYLSRRLRHLIRELQRIEREISDAGDISAHFKRAQRSYSCLW